MTPNQSNTFAERVTKLLTKDPKKSLVLTVLVVVLGIMWFRMMAGGSGTPRQASAMSRGPALPALNVNSKPADQNGQAALRSGWISHCRQR